MLAWHFLLTVPAKTLHMAMTNEKKFPTMIYDMRESK